MSFEFQSTLVNLTPEFRIAGEQIGGVRITTLPSNEKVARVILTSDKDLLFSSAGAPYQAANATDIYATLQPEMAEIVEDELLVNTSAISSVKYTAEEIIINIQGDGRPWRFVPTADPELLSAKEIADHTYELTAAGFAALTTSAGTFRDSVDGTLEGLNTAIVTEVADRIAAITAEEQRVDALIASGMWLFADQASFPAAADNHGRVVHSHADGAIFYAHAGAWHQVAKEVDLQSTVSSLASEASTREAADTALSDRVDVLEADPTTATAVAAGDAATLSSANTYTDTSITNLVNGADAALDTLKEIGDALAQGDSDVTAALTAQITTESTARSTADAALSGRLDTLEADPTTQSALDAEVTARTTADSALDGRVTTLEGNAAITDPTTATAVAAVQSDVDQNEADGDAADAALSGRLDVLEADPTTATAVATVQTNLDTEAGARASADSALDGRLDVLEADPTTATAVAAVQSDVDQNEADADAADAALSGRLDVLEADPTTATAVAAVQSDVDQNEADADAALALRPLLDGSNIPGPYANDAAAATAGIAVGAIYKHDNGQIHYRVS
jgi:hypothetical protein